MGLVSGREDLVLVLLAIRLDGGDQMVDAIELLVGSLVGRVTSSTRT
jgi:hypothetical protein